MNNYSIEVRVNVLQNIVLSIFGDNPIQKKLNKLKQSLQKEDYNQAFKFLNEINTNLHTMLHTKLGMDFIKADFMQNPYSADVDEILFLNDKVTKPTEELKTLFERAFLATMLNAKNAKYEFNAFKKAYDQICELENYEEQKASW